jgi:opacity protein-like surface antigen
MRKLLASGLIAFTLIVAVPPATWAYDTDAIRGYLGLRVGGQPLFTQADKDSAIHLENPGAEALGGAVLGVNLNKHWGVELAGEFEKTGLTDEATGRKTAEWAWWTILAQARWRYPLLDDRLTPYLLAGVGARIAQLETKDSDSPLVFGSTEAFTGAVGTGLEYFVMNNVALGVELKYIVGTDSQLKVSGNTHDLNLDAFIYTFGIRVFYPER